MTTITTSRQRLPSLNARMKTRRSQLGLTGAELAQRAGISPSYVSLIEKGVKVPEEEVAAGLARALEDDESLYRTWARAARLGLHDLDLLNRLQAIARTPAYVSLVESGQSLPRLDSPAAPSLPGDETSELAARMREVASQLGSLPVPGDLGPLDPPEALSGRPTAAAVIRVPVLAEGADPDRLATTPRAMREEMLVDRRLFAGPEPGPLFAYDVTPAAMTHLRGIAAPGDRIVFRPGQDVGPDRICAVRTPHGIALARVLLKGRSLLLLPGEGETDFESVDVSDPKGLPGVLAGTHVLLIRR